MDNEIQLISDGDGLAVIGDPAAVERFLVSEGLPSKDLGLPRLGAVLSTGAAAARSGSEIAANSGRWVKLTKESARLASKYGLRKSPKTGLSTGVLKGNSGQIKGFVQFARGPGSLLNPALLAGAAGIMAQVAMQQTIDDITDYLATIDEKLDDVLRAQEDAVLADMIGVGFDIDEAITIRDHAGRVNGRQSLEAKRWVHAASEVRDKVLETGAERVDASRRLGNETLDRARSVKGRLSSGIAERALRPRDGEHEERDEQG